MSVTAEVDRELVMSIVDQVWDSLLQTPVQHWQGPLPTGTGALRAQIALTGDWNGLVRLSCDTVTAELIAGRMLSIEDDEVLLPEDVHDAVGEVVNVVGGNFKGALGGTTSLGLPSVVAQPVSQPVSEPVAEPGPPASRCVLDWEGAPVVLEIFTGGPAEAARHP